ncbi:MAG: adenylate/guanylate cyclase domain-containing protein [Myxococcaceae bacterium]
MTRSAAEYEQEIAALRAELDRQRATPSLSRTLAVGGSSQTNYTVQGAEEMILLVGPDDTVGYVNRPMARLLEMSDPKEAVGTPLAQWDRSAIGDEVLSSLVRVTRSGAESHAVERTCPGLSLSLLPVTEGARPATDPVLRLCASNVKGRVQIAAWDVTRLRWLESTFSRYLSPAVIERLAGGGADSLLTMERKDITVLFCDLRGFTALSQTLPPEQVQELVNSFLGNMVGVIEALEGTIDKFVGDEVMALFGAPLAQADHAVRGLVCGVEMQRRHAGWAAERATCGKPSLPLGVGLVSGPVVVGNIGTSTRVEYTALGHTVNMAARLCGSAEGGEVLTLPQTHAQAVAAFRSYGGSVPLPHLSFRAKGRLSFKNVAEPVDVVCVSAK